MSFLKAIFDDAQALRSLGTEARALARSTGTEFVFCDPDDNELILIGSPNGSVGPRLTPVAQQRKRTIR